jgi:hypothetical protein
MNKFTELFELKKENILSLFFIVFLIMKFHIPEPLADTIDTIPGKFAVVAIAIMLFNYANPVLGVLGLFVAFELIRRSNVITPIGKVNTIQYTPKQFEKDEEMIKMNTNTVSNVNPIVNSNKTLEEEIVSQMAPLGVSEPVGYFPTTFRPVSENVHNATTM